MNKPEKSQEGVTLEYRIKNTDFDWMEKNFPKFFEPYKKMKDQGVDVDALVISYSNNWSPTISYNISGDAKTLESALDLLFSSECGLPYEVMKPRRRFPWRTKQGFKIAEKLINKYGKKLKTKFEGAFVSKKVC